MLSNATVKETTVLERHIEHELFNCQRLAALASGTTGKADDPVREHTSLVLPVGVVMHQCFWMEGSGRDTNLRALTMGVVDVESGLSEIRNKLVGGRGETAISSYSMFAVARCCWKRSSSNA